MRRSQEVPPGVTRFWENRAGLVRPIPALRAVQTPSGVPLAMDLAAQTGDLFDRFAAQDSGGVAALCAPGFLARQNNGPENDVETMLTGLGEMLWTPGVETAYSAVRRVVADRAVTEQHVVTLTRPDGVNAASDVCVVLRFDDDGLITRLDEYVDTAAFAPLFS